MKEETKEKAKGLIDKVKGVLDKGLNASKKALGIAGEAVQDFSDKSALRIEKKQLESKLKKQYEFIGEYVAAVFLSKKNASLTSKDKQVSEYLAEVLRIKKEIDVRKNALENEGSVTGKNEQKVFQTELQVKEKKSASKKTSVAKTVTSKTAEQTSKPSSKSAKRTVTKSAASSSSRKTGAVKTPAKSDSVKKTEKK